MCPFSGLKKKVTAFVEARGPGRNAPEASAGLPLGHENHRVFPPKGAGISSPPNPGRNQRLMIPIPPLAGPRAMEPLGPYARPLSKELKSYEKIITLNLVRKQALRGGPGA